MRRWCFSLHQLASQFGYVFNEGRRFTCESLCIKKNDDIAVVVLISGIRLIIITIAECGVLRS